MAIKDCLSTKKLAKMTAYSKKLSKLLQLKLQPMLRSYSVDFKFAGLARSPFVLTEHMTLYLMAYSCSYSIVVRDLSTHLTYIAEITCATWNFINHSLLILVTILSF